VISYYYNGNFFVFSEADAVFYHEFSQRLTNLSALDALGLFLLYSNFDDFGAILVISTLYKIVTSNLIVNFFYLIIGVFTSILIFRIGRNFMSQKYAFISALAYCTSSYVLWFHASGLKESIMIFLIIFFYDQYYKYVLKKRIFNILLMSFSLFALLLFRPVIIFFILASVFTTLLISRRKSASIIFTIIPFLIFLFYFSFQFIQELLDRVIGVGGISTMLETKESTGMIKVSLPVTILTNILAGFFGPFASTSPGEKMILSFYSVGLIFKILLSVVFWIGVYYAYKKKVYKIYPLILFVVFESFSLIFILEALELRKSLPHFFAIFVVSFWFLDFLEKKNSFSIISRKKIFSILSLSYVLLFFLMILWNFKGT
tara:strand:+ start:3573 stop:4694 length:1122 start_codon:yes stop_codon:yes gene_type:complete